MIALAALLLFEAHWLTQVKFGRVMSASCRNDILPVGETGVEREKPVHEMKGILCVSSHVLLALEQADVWTLQMCFASTWKELQDDLCFHQVGTALGGNCEP